MPIGNSWVFLRYEDNIRELVRVKMPVFTRMLRKSRPVSLETVGQDRPLVLWDLCAGTGSMLKEARSRKWVAVGVEVNRNLAHMSGSYCQDMREVDYDGFRSPDVMFASFPCSSRSKANTTGKP